MRNILDRLFYHRKLSIIIPWSVVAILYLLFAFFGSAEHKSNILIVTPIATVFWFFAVFFAIFFQIKVTSAPSWFLDLFSLAATIVFVSYGIIGMITFLSNGFENFNPIACACLITYASVSWAHNLRMD